ncbi:MAG: o-succinylbenzoate synthase [Actinobacteria bacterium]|nr:o-succinylbenzoate synthase [Actinomycetota bacterium]
MFNDLTIVAIPTRTSFRGITVREAAIFRGPAGWSEFAPFIEYNEVQSEPWLSAALEGAYKPWPELKRNKVGVNATLPKVEISRVNEILERFPGARTVKIKVDDFEKDSELVEAALDFNSDFMIRLDVNGGWDLETALLNLYNYNLRFGKVFEYIEQPCLEISDLRKLKAEIPMKIAIDESIRQALDSDFTDAQNFADIAIIKWAPSGGISRANNLIARIGLPAVISSALDTGIGISHGLALAATQNDLTLDCGLATLSLLESDVVLPALEISDGFITVNRTVPDEKLLSKYAASSDRRIWWQQRIEKIWESGFGERWQREQLN